MVQAAINGSEQSLSVSEHASERTDEQTNDAFPLA